MVEDTRGVSKAAKFLMQLLTVTWDPIKKIIFSHLNADIQISKYVWRWKLKMIRKYASEKIATTTFSILLLQLTLHHIYKPPLIETHLYSHSMKSFISIIQLPNLLLQCAGQIVREGPATIATTGTVTGLLGAGKGCRGVKLYIGDLHSWKMCAIGVTKCHKFCLIGHSSLRHYSMASLLLP